MAKLFESGFETNDYSEWSATGGSPSITTTNNRSGTYGAEVAATGSAKWFGKTYRTSGTPIDQAFRIYFKHTGTNAFIQLINCYVNGNSDGFTLRLLANHRLELRDNAIASAIDSNSTTLDPNTWYLIEVLITASTGNVEVFLDVAGASEGTSILSAAPTNFDIDTINIGSNNARTFTCYFDDIQIDSSSTRIGPGAYTGGGSDPVTNPYIKLSGVFGTKQMMVKVGGIFQNVTPIHIWNDVDTEAPTAPSIFELSNATETTLDYSFTGSTDNVGIVDYVITLNGVDYVVTALTGTIEGLTAGTSYTGSVIARDAEGNESDPSNEDTLSTEEIDITAPSVPTDFTLSNATATTMDFSLTTSTDAVGVEGYRIYDAADDSLVGDFPSTSGTITGLTADTSYTFYATAYDAAENESAGSDEDTLSTTDQLYNFRIRQYEHIHGYLYYDTKEKLATQLAISSSDIGYYSYDAGLREATAQLLIDVHLTIDHELTFVLEIEDIDGRIKSIDQDQFSYGPVIYANLPGITTVSTDSFTESSLQTGIFQNAVNINVGAFGRLTDLEHLDIRNATNLNENAFFQISSESAIIYAHSSLATSNGGGEDAAIAVARANGATIIYI